MTDSSRICKAQGFCRRIFGYIQKEAEMKKLFKYLKVLVLTFLTCGLYGAYWILANMNEEPDKEEMNEAEQNARKAQNVFSLSWLHFMNR